MERTISITVSEALFQKIHSIASATNRTIDDVIATTVDATYTAPVDIPAPIANELAVMQQAKDDALWDAISPSVSPQQRERLVELNAISNERELLPAELNEKQDLLMAHHHSILRRAQAIAILTLRGYSISDDLLRSSVL